MFRIGDAFSASAYRSAAAKMTRCLGGVHGVSYGLTDAVFRHAIWLGVVCALAAISALCLLIVVRSKRAACHMRRRWETRRAERERIARELHDTLLQSVQGLIFRLRTEVERLPGPERARIGVALERAVGVVDETRQKIQDLRSNPERSLGDGVDEMRGELTSLYEIPITRRVDGNERGVDAFACAEIVAIVREALSNACRHSHGTRIDISLGFRTAHLYVSVRDNGKGMIQELASAKARSAHWGLHGMHERARILSASLSIRSRVGKGTTVLLKVPAETAYTHPSIQTDAISQPNTGDVSESAA